MNLNGRSIDAWGNVALNRDGLIDLLMRGIDITDDLVVQDSPDITKYNKLCKELDHPDDQVRVYQAPSTPLEEWDSYHQSQWFTPEPFASIDVQEWLFNKCQTEEEVARIIEEFELFKERNMEPLLRFLIYLVDDLRKRNVVWGVGRGSSVASYALYLIGVHKVNSLAYGLDVKEFLK